MAQLRKRQSLRRNRRVLFLESLELRNLLAATLSTEAVDYSQSRVIVRFESQEAPTELIGGMLENGEVLSQSGNVHRFDLRAGYEMQQVIAALTSATGVLFAQPDYKFSSALTPNDPSFSQLWGLSNSGGASGTVADADIDAPQAWDIQRGSSNILVAIIDTGIDYRHSDLAANIWTNPGEIAGNGRDDDGNGYVDDIHGYDFANNDGDALDDNGHGTHVAGTIGAVGNNGIGIVGVNWNVKMMALKFLDGDGSGYNSDAIRAIDYAVRMGAKISNNSWGGGGNSAALADAISRARSAGHIFVAAAGNEGANNNATPNYPSNYNYDNIIAVAATGATDQLASWSNYGATTVDLAAPGVNILSTLPGNRYGRLSGTSMATPHVTGVVALVMSQYPNLTYRQVIDKVLASVDKLSQLSGKVVTGGRLNAAKALGSGSSTTPPGAAQGPYVLGSAAYGSNGAITAIDTLFDRPIDPTSVSLPDIASFTGPTGASLLSSITGIYVNGSNLLVTFTPMSDVGLSKLVLGPSIRDLAGNWMDQDRDGTSAEAIDDRWSATLSLGGNVAVTSTQQVLIADRRTVTSTIYVAREMQIADLNVALNIRHTYDSDLQISLTSPTGRTISLINRRGGGGDHFAGTILDDEATRSIASGAAPFTGAYRPEMALSGFDGLLSQGTWTLTITDVARLDTGTLLGWSLGFTSASSFSASGNRGTSLSSAEAISIDRDTPETESSAAFHTFAFREDPTPENTAPLNTQPSEAAIAAAIAFDRAIIDQDVIGRNFIDFEQRVAASLFRRSSMRR